MCVMCGKEHKEKLVKFEDTILFKGVEVTFKSDSYYCEEYDDYFDDESLIKANDIAMKDAYRVKVGLLTSIAIKAIREKYGISQKDMGFIMGWGTSTFGRYETSQVQDEAHNDLLKNIANPSWLLAKLELKKELIIGKKGSEFYNKHHLSVSRLTLVDKIIDEKDLIGALSVKKVKLSNVFDVAKYFLSKAPISPLKLQKIVYLAFGHVAALMNDSRDKEKISLFAKPIEAWVHGPVVRDLYAHYSTHGGNDIPMVNDANVKITKVTELILDIVWNKYKSMTAKELEDLTHQQSPWVNARGGLGGNESSTEKLIYSDIYDYFSSEELISLC